MGEKICQTQTKKSAWLGQDEEGGLHGLPGFPGGWDLDTGIISPILSCLYVIRTQICLLWLV